MNPELQQLITKIDALERKMNEHIHTGLDGTRAIVVTIPATGTTAPTHNAPLGSLYATVEAGTEKLYVRYPSGWQVI